MDWQGKIYQIEDIREWQGIKWMSETYDVSNRYLFLRKMLLLSPIFYRLSYKFLKNKSYFLTSL